MASTFTRLFFYVRRTQNIKTSVACCIWKIAKSVRANEAQRTREKE